MPRNSAKSAKPPKGSNEAIFLSYKGHIAVFAGGFERSFPPDKLLPGLVEVILDNWRSMRHEAIKQMKNDKERLVLFQRNLQEYGDSIGPQMQYMGTSTEDSQKAKRILSHFVAINGWEALNRLEVEWRRNFSPESFYPHALEGLISIPIRAYLTKQVNAPWRFETEEHGEVLVRVNLFPDEPLYSLVSRGTVMGHFSNWPKPWKRDFPPSNAAPD